ncbi:AAA family ATPase [Nocardia cyriacigeorgica]|uniref:phosphatase domain-containing protein n=1 Tax=Nocardia cyriacigeorgica TaxID=135487 RepID=UPI001895CA53|nr:AAA family ATPase [Nocardia cyriacigeorgica]MBF6085165.1 AAA family ATPase [Nocardia cyriacigeorgica]
MPTLAITRGPQGAGKTALARKWAAPNHAVRLSRDDFREMCFNRSGVLDHDDENIITKMITAAAQTALRTGRDVVIDATNLRARHARVWADLAEANHAHFETLDVVTSMEECIRRDIERGERGGRRVGREVIEATFNRYPLPWPKITATVGDTIIDPYVPDDTKPLAWIVDIDGTLARHTTRSPYDYTRVSEDELIDSTADLVSGLAINGFQLILFSGRDDSCRADTVEWLHKHNVDFDELHMRRTGDKRKDNVVKLEMFNTHARNRFHVVGVIDDRLRVVRMWHRLGLTVYRVGDPDADF